MGSRASAGGPGRNQPRPDDNSDFIFIYYPVRLRLLGVVSQCREIRLGKLGRHGQNIEGVTWSVSDRLLYTAVGV